MQKDRPTQEEFLLHKERKDKEVHKKENPLRDVILGGQDGLVNALGIILGVLAASSDVKILITTVIAASIAESISMGAVAYTSAIAQRDYYRSERRKEEDEIEKHPEMEREEIRKIYEEKGLKGQSLEDLVDTITSNKKVWVDVMMSEELHIEPVNSKKVLKSSYIVTVATAIGHFIPLLPFFFLAPHVSFITAIIISALTLFSVGIYQAITLVGSWWKSGARMLLIGLGAAGAGYLIATLFHAVI
jgi:VIT1/CCC1 family predicted Fe2+/Mn2+ transporter